MSSPIDPIATLTLAWKLYHQCWKVASDAPDGFRQLVDELFSTHKLLSRINNSIEPGADTTAAIDVNSRNALLQETANTKNTLRTLEKVIAPFHRLLDEESRRNFWLRFRWSYEQQKIQALQQRLTAHNHIITLSFSAMEYDQIQILRQRLEQALAHRPAPAPVQVFPLTATEVDDGTSMESHVPSSGNFSITGADTPITVYTDEGAEHTSLDLDSVIQEMRTLNLNHRQRSWSFSRPAALRAPPPPPADCVVESKTAKRFSRGWRAMPPQEDSEFSPISRWITCATWWLCKAKHAVSLFRRHQGEKPPRQGQLEVPCLCEEASLRQGLDNLRKAAWILYEKILNDEKNDAHLEFHREIEGLTSSLEAEFEVYHKISIDKLFEETDNLGETIWERPCNVEVKLDYAQHANSADESLLGYFPPVRDQKWVALSKKDAGLPGEHVLYRSFVNADIGGRDFGHQTRNQPYMLILHCHDSHPEPKITLCSQMGQMSLTKDFTTRDLQSAERLLKWLASPNHDHLETTALTFRSEGSQKMFQYEVEFQCPRDLETFIRKPRRFFHKVAARNQLLGETLLYRCVVDSFASVNPKNDNERHAWSGNAEVRVYEKAAVGDWMRTRRIVASGSVKEDEPWCHSSFLPMDDVEIRESTDRERVLNLRFSNCNQLSRPARGDHNHNYSCVYKPATPNACFDITFQSTAHARQFKERILTLRPHGTKVALANDQQVTVHTVSGATVLQIRTVASDREYTQIFSVPQSTRLEFSDELSVILPDLLRPVPRSNHENKTFPLQGNAEFAFWDEVEGRTTLKFTDQQAMKDFLEALTGGWTLCERCSVKQVIVGQKKKRLFGKSRGASRKPKPDVMLWRKGEMRRLVIRRDGSEPWLSAPIMDYTRGIPLADKDSDRGALEVDLTLGTALDFDNMEATCDSEDGRNQRRQLHGVTITIQFSSCREKEQFAEAAGLRLP